MNSKIKFIIPVAVVLALLAFGYFKAVPKPQTGNENYPKIEISPPSFDYGQVAYGDVVEYDFIVKNTGFASLKINKVATSCGCTTAKISLEELNPGEEAKLHVIYNTGAMSGPHGMGRQERIIYVKSNDPISPQTQVIIYGNVN